MECWNIGNEKRKMVYSKKYCNNMCLGFFFFKPTVPLFQLLRKYHNFFPTINQDEYPLQAGPNLKSIEFTLILILNLLMLNS